MRSCPGEAMYRYFPSPSRLAEAGKKEPNSRIATTRQRNTTAEDRNVARIDIGWPPDGIHAIGWPGPTDPTRGRPTSQTLAGAKRYQRLRDIEAPARHHLAGERGDRVH